MKTEGATTGRAFIPMRWRAAVSAAGRIYGASNAAAGEPDRDPVTVEDFLATVYHQVGIDSTNRLLAPGRRPIDIVRDGKVVQGLVG